LEEFFWGVRLGRSSFGEFVWGVRLESWLGELVGLLPSSLPLPHHTCGKCQEKQRTDLFYRASRKKMGIRCTVQWEQVFIRTLGGPLSYVRNLLLRRGSKCGPCLYCMIIVLYYPVLAWRILRLSTLLVSPATLGMSHQ